MSIIVDGSGRRSVTLSVQIPGSVEEVWEAVASGPGLSGWRLPTETQLGFDGLPVRLLTQLDSETVEASEVRHWDPPSRYSTITEDLWMGAPPVIREWSIESPSDPDSQGSAGCRVVIELSLVSEVPDWDFLLRAGERHWRSYFGVLAAYLTHFSGKRCVSFSLLGLSPGGQDRAWETLSEPLGLSHARPGERFKSEADAPVLAGVVESGVEDSPFQVFLRLDEPAPGLVNILIWADQGFSVVCLRFYFYSEQAAAVVRREEPHWSAWLSELFPG